MTPRIGAGSRRWGWVSEGQPTVGPFLTSRFKTVTPLSPSPHSTWFPAAREAHLLMELGGRHLLQVLQVGVEEPAADERHAQQGLHDVANGAVIWQADPLGCAHEVAPAAGGEGPTDQQGWRWRSTGSSMGRSHRQAEPRLG